MRIQRLDLFAHDLQALGSFYERLGLVCKPSVGALSISCGETQLNFHQSEEKPNYHFAFNIPANRLQACHDWLGAHADLLPFEGSTVIDFPNWKAQSVYALDPAQNIIEFIARKDVGPGSEAGAFQPGTELLNISEIGCPVQRIPDFRDAISMAQVPVYSGGDQYFCALGDEHGLFIVVDPGKEFWLPTELKAVAYPLQCVFQQNDEVYTLEFSSQSTHLNS